MLHLDVGQWSGFNRKMESAESFVQPLLTVRVPSNSSAQGLLTNEKMLRRSGKMSFAPDSIVQMPTMSDTTDVLDSKWEHFIIRESYKRSVT